MDVSTGERSVLKEFDHLIEAPNWLPDGDRILYNAGGSLWIFRLSTGESQKLDTGFAACCNNDHVLSPDGRSVGLSHGTAEDGWSRVYTVPLSGGVPRPVSYTHLDVYKRQALKVLKGQGIRVDHGVVGFPYGVDEGLSLIHISAVTSYPLYCA